MGKSNKGMEGSIIPSTETESKEVQTIDISKLPHAYNLYKEFIGKTKIEKLKKEDDIIRAIVRGDTPHKIAKILNSQYPKYSITTWKTDVEKFIERSDELLVFFERDRELVANRYLDASLKVQERMAQLALFTEKLIIDLNESGDSSNTIAAVNALAKVYGQYNSLMGFNKEKSSVNASQTNININLGDENFQRLRDRANRADFKVVDIDIDGKVQPGK